jgi:hypothetical protein
MNNGKRKVYSGEELKGHLRGESEIPSAIVLYLGEIAIGEESDHGPRPENE